MNETFNPYKLENLMWLVDANHNKKFHRELILGLTWPQHQVFLTIKEAKGEIPVYDSFVVRVCDDPDAPPIYSGGAKVGKIDNNNPRVHILLDENDAAPGVIEKVFSGMTDSFFYLEAEASNAP